MKTLKIGQTIIFGATRKMKIDRIIEINNNLIQSKLYLTGIRGGKASAFLYKSGNIRMI